MKTTHNIGAELWFMLDNKPTRAEVIAMTIDFDNQVDCLFMIESDGIPVTPVNQDQCFPSKKKLFSNIDEVIVKTEKREDCNE